MIAQLDRYFKDNYPKFVRVARFFEIYPQYIQGLKHNITPQHHIEDIFVGVKDGFELMSYGTIDEWEFTKKPLIEKVFKIASLDKEYLLEKMPDVMGNMDCFDSLDIALFFERKLRNSYHRFSYNETMVCDMDADDLQEILEYMREYESLKKVETELLRQCADTH